MKNTAWLAVAFVVAVVGFVLFSTFHQQRLQCRVCVSYNGNRDCRTASATTRQEAIRAAVTNACAQLASGVTDSIRCENTQPDSVEWLR